ncbi:MAG: hypothetical protein H5T85_03320 [Actinobacteria bacterium]|nr:hypothetical protein [Actinomycetota bacterium]
MGYRNKKSKMLFLTTVLLFVISLYFLLPGTIFAQTTEEETEETVIPEKLEFDITYPELKAKAGEQFSFKMDLTYTGKEEEVTFDLTTEGPEGWYVGVTPAYEQTEISAVKLKPAKKESLKAVAIPLVKPQPGEYKITVKASNEELGLEATAEFLAIVTATYELDLTTKSGRLDTKVTSGKDNHLIIKLENKGSDSIEKITLSADEPEGWIVEFDPKEVEKIEAGKSKEVDVTITPPEKTIAGDYMLTISAKSENAEDKIEVRVTVLTPTIWGWVGIGIIVIVIVGIAVTFARLGRR